MSFSINYHHTIGDCIYAELVVDPMSTYVRVRLGTDLTLFMSQEAELDRRNIAKQYPEIEERF